MSSFLKSQHVIYFIYRAFVITNILYYFSISILSCNMMACLKPEDLEKKKF